MLKQAFGVNIMKTQEEQLPDTKEELELHMQLTYKQAVEIAEEQAINLCLKVINTSLLKKDFIRS